MSSTPASASETSGGCGRGAGPRPEEHLRDRHLARERLRDAPTGPPPASAGSVRHSRLGEQVLGEPARQDELAPERLAQALAEQRARERVDDAGDEHAVEPAARVGGDDEIVAAGEHRLEQRAEPPGVARPGQRLEQRARGRAAGDRDLEQGGERRLRPGVAAGVDRRRRPPLRGREHRPPASPRRPARRSRTTARAARPGNASLQPGLERERRLARRHAVGLGRHAHDHVGPGGLVWVATARARHTT